MAPAVGLEPTTKRLTAARSTTELRRSEDRRGTVGATEAVAEWKDSKPHRPDHRPPAHQRRRARDAGTPGSGVARLSFRRMTDAASGPLISPERLAALADDARIRVVDVRWYLDRPGDGRRAYAAGHIPGAIYLDVDTDLVAPQGPGRHPRQRTRRHPHPLRVANSCARTPPAFHSTWPRGSANRIPHIAK